MAETATRTRTFLPSISMRIFCRFGLKRRLVMPVTLRPTPPRYLALPRRRILLPPTGFLPVIAHCIPIADSFSFSQRRNYMEPRSFDKFEMGTCTNAAMVFFLSRTTRRRYHTAVRRDMARSIVSSYLVLILAAGPALCCCTFGRTTAAPMSPVVTESCCRHCSPEKTSPKQRVPQKPECPCRHSPSGCKLLPTAVPSP